MVLGYICRHIQYVFDITMGQRELRHVFGVYTTDIQYMPHMYLTLVGQGSVTWLWGIYHICPIHMFQVKRLVTWLWGIYSIYCICLINMFQILNPQEGLKDD